VKKSFFSLIIALLSFMFLANAEDVNPPKTDKTKLNLDRIIIPKMEFKDAPVAQVVSEIHKASIAADPDKRGVNLVLLLNKDEKDKLPVVSMVYDANTLTAIIENLCKEMKLRYNIENDTTVFIYSGELNPSCMETRIYPVEKDAFVELGTACQSKESQKGEMEPYKIRSDIEEYFIRSGIPFPVGAKVVFDSRISRLIVTNTPDNLELIERLILELNVVDPQVGIEVEFLKISESDFRSLVGDDVLLEPRKLNSSLYKKLIESDKTRIVASSYVLTQNGQEATIKMNSERYFPASWINPLIADNNNIAPVADNDKKDEKEKKKSCLVYEFVPELGEPAGLGISFSFTPTVDADYYTISLDMTPVVQSHTGWTDYAFGDSKIKMPEFAISTVETKAVVYNGETLLLESSRRDEPVDGGDKVVPVMHFVFASVNLIDPGGMPLRNAARIKKLSEVHLAPVYERAFKLQQANPGLLKKLSVKTDFELSNCLFEKAIDAVSAKMKTEGLQVKNEIAREDCNMSVSMFLRDIPLGELLRFFSICEGVEIAFDGEDIKLISRKYELENKMIHMRAVLISCSPPSSYCDNASTRVLEVKMESDLKNISGSRALEDYLKQMGVNPSMSMREYFINRGVGFPKGTLVAYDRKTGCLIVRNTKDNFQKLEFVMRELDIETPLINIQFDMMEISYDILAKLMKDNKGKELSGKSLYQAVHKSGKAKVTSQRVLATSGQPALGRQGSEKYFPINWTAPKVNIKDNSSSYVPSCAKFLDFTELGQRLEVTATVSPNNYTISLNLHPRIREHVGWTEYQYQPILNKMSEKSAPEKNKIVMPEFSLRDISTNVKAYDGETLLVGKTYLGFDPERESFFNYRSGKYDGKVILFFITPVLVTPDGKPVRK